MKVLGVEITTDNPGAEANLVLTEMVTTYLRVIEENFLALVGAGEVAVLSSVKTGVILRVSTKGVQGELIRMGKLPVDEYQANPSTAFRVILGADCRSNRLGGVLKHSANIPLLAACRRLKIKFLDYDFRSVAASVSSEPFVEPFADGSTF